MALVTTPERFEAKVSYEPMSGCWLWTGHIDRFGYGAFWVNGKVGKAHRVAWVLKNGTIGKGLEVDHVCHNRSCVNPDHLRLATHTENMRNMLLFKNNKARLKGVYLNKRTGRWCAHIRINGLLVHLGYFDTPERAHKTYCDAAREWFGEFACGGAA